MKTEKWASLIILEVVEALLIEFEQEIREETYFKAL